MKRIILAALALAPFAALAGEYHTNQTLICADCHTMHYSQSHQWLGANPIPFSGSGTGAALAGGPQLMGNWYSETRAGFSGPNHYLLKGGPESMNCIACHDGQTIAPDVVGTADANATPGGRSGGFVNILDAEPINALDNGVAEGAGHTMFSTAAPPGYQASSTAAYDPAGGLQCFSCHIQHGYVNDFRNLGYRGDSTTRPTYTVVPAAPANGKALSTHDVTIVYGGAAEPGAMATRAALFSKDNVLFAARNVATQTGGATAISGEYGIGAAAPNRVDILCASCHGDFHGAGTADGSTYGIVTPGDPPLTAGEHRGAWIRHPTYQAAIFSYEIQGTHGHTNVNFYKAAGARVRAYWSDKALWTDASGTIAANDRFTAYPGCLSCHRAHGSQNSFGLVYTIRSTATADGTDSGAGDDVRFLCANCHGQGNRQTVTGGANTSTIPGVTNFWYR